MQRRSTEPWPQSFDPNILLHLKSILFFFVGYLAVLLIEAALLDVPEKREIQCFPYFDLAVFELFDPEAKTPKLLCKSLMEMRVG